MLLTEPLEKFMLVTVEAEKTATHTMKDPSHHVLAAKTCLKISVLPAVQSWKKEPVSAVNVVPVCRR